MVTPGPWRATHRHVYGRPHDDEIDGLGWNIHGPPQPMRGMIARAADAHAIAAVPEMVGALKSVPTPEDYLDDLDFAAAFEAWYIESALMALTKAGQKPSHEALLE